MGILQKCEKQGLHWIPPRRFPNDSNPLKTKQKTAEADIHPKKDTAYK